MRARGAGGLRQYLSWTPHSPHAFSTCVRVRNSGNGSGWCGVIRHMRFLVQGRQQSFVPGQSIHSSVVANHMREYVYLYQADVGTFVLAYSASLRTTARPLWCCRRQSWAIGHSIMAGWDSCQLAQLRSCAHTSDHDTYGPF